MCETENNKTIQLIQKKFNDISKKYFGELDNTILIEQVDPSQIGNHMIENFESFIFEEEEK